MNRALHSSRILEQHMAPPREPFITEQPYAETGQNVYADGALLGRYWPRTKPKPWDDTASDATLCEPGMHKERPFHARALFGLGPATHHATPEEAVAELLAAREHPHPEQVEIYDSLRNPEPGVREAVRYARDVMTRRS